MNKISAVLIVRNEEKKIKKCLESIKWCDEIIVVDQSSTDRTIEVVREYTNKIFITEPKGICNPDREYAISQTKNKFILLIEADEVVSDELKNEIIENLKMEESYDIFYIPFKNYFLGKWIKSCGWHPVFLPRLFKKGSIVFESDIHTNGRILGNKIKYLEGYINHFSYETIDEWIDKFKRYTSRYAYEYYRDGKKHNFKNFVREVFIRPFYFFVLKYFYLKGFKDGWRGFFISLSSALTIMFSYFKLIELYEKNSN